jgi:integrase
MANRYEFYAKVGEGDKAVSVGYSTTVRAGCFGVRFVDPSGTRIEKMTVIEAPPARGKSKPTPPAALHIEAVKLIGRAYAPAHSDAKRISFEDAMKEVEATTTDLRPATLHGYKRGVEQLRATLEADDKTPKKPTGPSDITPEIASRFSRLFLATPYKRSKASDAEERKRSPATLSYYLRSLSGLWGQFLDLGYTAANPWDSVRRPEVEKKRKHVPTEEEITQFFDWLYRRYPTWERLTALLHLKLLSGCRTNDIVQLKRDQLKSGNLVFRADQTKTKEDRLVPLPAELFARLTQLAGPIYLWEYFLDDVRAFRPSKNKLPEKFTPKTVYWVLSNLFREYSDAHPDHPRLNPHDFRRRAITIMATATGSTDMTAQVYGLSQPTARQYYLDAKRAFNTTEAFKACADLLIPAHTIPTPLQNNGEQKGTGKNNRYIKNARKTGK